MSFVGSRVRRVAAAATRHRVVARAVPLLFGVAGFLGASAAALAQPANPRRPTTAELALGNRVNVPRRAVLRRCLQRNIADPHLAAKTVDFMVGDRAIHFTDCKNRPTYLVDLMATLGAAYYLDQCCAEATSLCITATMQEDKHRRELFDALITCLRPPEPSLSHDLAIASEPPF